jgi:N-acetylneuraminic acid mutarotase
MLKRRINPGACYAQMSDNYIFVFGGRSDGDEMYESIERYNIDINTWNMLEIRLP